LDSGGIKIFPAGIGWNHMILVIEDDLGIQKVLHRLFVTEGFQVKQAVDGKEAHEAMKGLAPEVVILDLMLPGASGKDLCKSLKQAFPNVPVIVLSAIADVTDKVLLLELGADDYVTKPFSPRELLARVQAAVRRLNGPKPVKTYSFGGVTVDFLKMEAKRDGHPVALTAHEFRLLKFMLENAERVLSREELLNHVWGYNCYPSTRTVDNQMLKLRQKLEIDPSNPKHIRTMHGVGYKFVDQV
jgi:DNA-binding response OmpR family regulator